MPGVRKGSLPREQRHKNRVPLSVRMKMWKDPCAVCGSDYRTCVDHIHPLAKGGTNDQENLQTLCEPCNCRKGTVYTNEQMREWYQANKAKIDAERREQEYYRYHNFYDRVKPVPADFLSRRQRDEAEK